MLTCRCCKMSLSMCWLRSWMNFWSWLQKYRLYLKRLSGPPHQQTKFGSMDERYLGLGDFQTHFPTQAMASSLQTGLLDRKSSKNHLLGQIAALHGSNNSISVGKIPHGLLNSSTINAGQLAFFDKSHNNRFLFILIFIYLWYICIYINV